MNNKSYKIYLITFFVILALPLLAAPPWFHPAAWGKAMVFRIIISSLLFFIIWQLISKKIKINFRDLLDRKNKVFWPFWLLFALWGIFLLATIFSLNPYYSFWESPYRAGGFLNFSCYIIFTVLAFLIIREKDWQKLWKFSLTIGILASVIALLQYFQIFNKYFVPYEGRPPSTFGNSVFLAIYLLFLIFIALSFLLTEKQRKRKLFYFLALLLFVFIILITKNRATYLGLLLGSMYFFFLYPAVKQKKILCLKIIATVILFLIVWGVYFVNTQDQIPEFVQNNKILKTVASRFSFKLLLQESRFSAWQVAIEAVKEKPILGWGPENFSIAFDKHYDPRLPELPRIWWDKAHNFMLDISVTAGIPALIIYLSLFTVLFWQLQKIKRKNPRDALICHIVQATFIAYLTANFFSFDSFSTYLISFLLIAYSLFLIQKNNRPAETLSPQACGERVSTDGLWRSGIIFVLFCILIIFIWLAGLKPLIINKEINWADYYAGTGQCQKAIEKMETKILPSQSTIDSYAKFKYIEIINRCSGEIPGLRVTLAPKVISTLKEVAKIRPYYTRTWLYLGNFTNLLIENSEYLKIKNIEDLKKDAYSFFEKAKDLSPKREEVFIGWIETDFLSKNYQQAKEKAEYCIELNPERPHCWWKKALSYIYLGELEQAYENIAIAHKKGQDLESDKSLSQLQRAYMIVLEATKDKELQTKSYEKLAYIYKELAQYVDPNNFQYHASAAHIYKILGRYREAREQAIFVVRTSKESQENVKEFLDLIFSLDNDYFQNHFALAHFYNELGDYKKALEQALIAKKLVPPMETVKEEDVIRILELDIWQFIKNLPR